MEDLIIYVKGKGYLSDTQIEVALCEYLDINGISYEYNQDFSKVIKLIKAKLNI